MTVQVLLEVDWDGDGVLGEAASGNLCTNGSFESNTTGWQTDGTNTIARSTTKSRFGDYSLLCTYKSGGDRYRLAEWVMNGSNPLTATQHTASVYVFIPTGYHGTDVHIRQSNFSGASEVIGHADMALRDQWQRITLSLTPVGGDLEGEIRISEDDSAIQNNDFIYIDGFRLETAATASPFSLDDLTPDLRMVECRRGRDYASQIIGRSSAGQLRAVLNNHEGGYSPFNTSSPLYGALLPGRRVRLRVLAPVTAVLFTGFLERIDPSAGKSQLTMATLYAFGAFANLTGPNNLVSPAVVETGTTGDVIDAVLDAAGWPAGDRQIDAGNVEVRGVYFDNVDALAAMREAEDTELGFLYEGLDWDIVFESRYNRDLNQQSSQATFTDDGVGPLGYQVVEESDYLREIANEVTAEVRPTAEGSLTVLWTLTGETLTLQAGESRTYFAKADRLGDQTVAYVSEWVTPVIGTDIVQSGVSDSDIDVTVFKTAKTMGITIENQHGTDPSTFTLVQARGTPQLVSDAYRLTEEDATSKAAFGRRTYAAPGRWYFNSAYAQGGIEYVLTKKKDPHPTTAIEIAGANDTHLTQMFTRTLSERITIEAESMAKLGINADFYIEAITHHFEQGRYPRTTWELSPAGAATDYFTLDTSELDGTDVLAY